MSILLLLIQSVILACFFSESQPSATIVQSVSRNSENPVYFARNISTKSERMASFQTKSQSGLKHKSETSRTRRSFVRPMISMFHPECGKTFRARAVVVYSGSGLKLTCDPCGYVKEGVVWTKLPLESFHQQTDTGSLNGMETIIPPVAGMESALAGGNEIGTFYGEDMALFFSRSTSSDAGIYQCKVASPVTGEPYIKSRPLSYYYVEVKIEPILQEVVLDRGEKPRSDRLIREGNDWTAMVYTLWSSWGRCNDCDVEGRRKRLGYCYVLLLEDVFSGGIPCQSSLLPDDAPSTLQLLKDIQLETSCMVYCIDVREPSFYGNGPFTGLFIHGGGNSYRNLDERMNGQETLRVEEKSVLRLECPEAYVEDAVRWRRAGHVMQVPIEDPVEGVSRIFMDPEGTLIFRSLLLNDTSRYECHVNQQRMANYRVYVFEQIIDRQETIEAFGFLSILIGGYTVVFVILLLCKYCLRQVVNNEMRKLGEDGPLLDEDAAEEEKNTPTEGDIQDMINDGDQS